MIFSSLFKREFYQYFVWEKTFSRVTLTRRIIFFGGKNLSNYFWTNEYYLYFEFQTCCCHEFTSFSKRWISSSFPDFKDQNLSFLKNEKNIVLHGFRANRTVKDLRGKLMTQLWFLFSLLNLDWAEPIPSLLLV